MEKTVRFTKTDAAQQIATGIVYAPLRVDSQGDFMTAEGIEKAAHGFVAKGYTRNIDVNHDGKMSGAYVVESYIAKTGDPSFPQGAWVIGVKVPQLGLWKAVEKGDLTGFSLSGSGTRFADKLDGKDAKRIDDLDVEAISLVERPANREKFLMLKSENGEGFDEALANFTTTITAALEKFATTQGEIELKLAQLAGGNVTKGESALEQSVQKSEDIRKGQRVAYLQKKISLLQDKWEQNIERPDLRNFRANERKITEQIEECELELAALGHQESAPLDSGSGFLHRGGTSNFLSADSAMDISHEFGMRSPMTIAKGEGPLGHNTMGVSTSKEAESQVDLTSMKI